MRLRSSIAIACGSDGAAYHIGISNAPYRWTGEQWQRLNIVADDVAVVQGDRAWYCREGRAYERTGTEWVERTPGPLAWCG